MTTDEYMMKLSQILEQMTGDEIRQVWRFARFVHEDQEPEVKQARDDPIKRYQEFVQWAQANGIDLGEMDGWSRQSSPARPVDGDEA